jgi:hypothetical protein
MDNSISDTDGKFDIVLLHQIIFWVCDLGDEDVSNGVYFMVKCGNIDVRYGNEGLQLKILLDIINRHLGR